MNVYSDVDAHIRRLREIERDRASDLMNTLHATDVSARRGRNSGLAGYMVGLAHFVEAAVRRLSSFAGRRVETSASRHAECC